MVPGPELWTRLRDEQWRYALPAGLAMLPLMAWVVVQSTGSYDMWPVFWSGFLVGLLYDAEGDDALHAGIRAGAITALPVFAVFWYDELAAIIRGGTVTFSAVEAALFGVFNVLLLGAVAIMALIGAKIGGWTAEKFGRPRVPGVGA